MNQLAPTHLALHEPTADRIDCICLPSRPFVKMPSRIHPAYPPPPFQCFFKKKSQQRDIFI